MNRLPQETVCCIADFLAQDPGTDRGLSDYATISRLWQHAIERHTFSKIRLFAEDLRDFEKIMTPERRVSLEDLHLSGLTKYHARLRPRSLIPHSGEASQAKIRDPFRNFLLRVFQLLHKWEQGTESRGRDITLSVNHSQIPGQSLQIAVPGQEMIPPVHRITSLKVSGGTVGCVSPAIAASLPSLDLPCLTTVRLALVDTVESLSIVERRENRHQMAMEMGEWNLDNLTVIDLSGSCSWVPRDERVAPPDIVHLDFPHPDIQGRDHLSFAIHKVSLAAKLRKLLICHKDNRYHDPALTLSTEVFWPQPLHHQNPHWPCLEELKIDFSRCSPLGKWEFWGSTDPTILWRIASRSGMNEIGRGPVRRAREVGELFPYSYRDTPYHCHIRWYFLLAAQALRNMPRMKDFTLTWPMPRGFAQSTCYIHFAGTMDTHTDWESANVLPQDIASEALSEGYCRVYLSGGRVATDFRIVRAWRLARQKIWMSGHDIRPDAWYKSMGL